MELKPALKKLEERPDFRNWYKKNKSTYFSYAFNIPQEMPDEWQLGFYNRKKDKITTFVLNSNGVSMKPEEEVFKKEETKVNEINMEGVKITFEAALGKAGEFQSKNYPKDKGMKTIAILQNMEGFGTIWNITYITGSFNTLNMKIDASTGNVIEHNISSIFSFRKD